MKKATTQQQLFGDAEVQYQSIRLKGESITSITSYTVKGALVKLDKFGAIIFTKSRTGINQVNVAAGKFTLKGKHLKPSLFKAKIHSWEKQAADSILKSIAIK